MLDHTLSQNIWRPSAFAPLRASVTVEAALVLPMFLVAVVVLFFGFGYMSTKLGVVNGLVNSVYEARTYGNDGVKNITWMSAFYEYTNADSNYLVKRSAIVPIISSGDGNNFSIKAAYYSMPGIISKIGLSKLEEQTVSGKYFSGYVLGSSASTNSNEKYIKVFKAENGQVYHLSEKCTYISLKPEMKNRNELSVLRNESGAKYYPCERCNAEHGEFVWVTEYGDKYHSGPECSGLKRSYKEVMIKDEGDVRYCSKCGGAHD